MDIQKLKLLFAGLFMSWAVMFGAIYYPAFAVFLSMTSIIGIGGGALCMNKLSFDAKMAACVVPWLWFPAMHLVGFMIKANMQ